MNDLGLFGKHFLVNLDTSDVINQGQLMNLETTYGSGSLQNLLFTGSGMGASSMSSIENGGMPPWVQGSIPKKSPCSGPSSFSSSCNPNKKKAPAKAPSSSSSGFNSDSISDLAKVYEAE